MSAGRSSLPPLVYFISILALFFVAVWAATHLLGLVLPAMWAGITVVFLFALASAFGVGRRYVHETGETDDSD